MARRKKATPPAPMVIKIFWGLAIGAAVVLGPLLLLRADWMWGDGSATAETSSTQVTTVAEAVQIRLKIDLLQGKPWVIHAIAPQESRAEAVQACLIPERGWQRMETADEFDVYYRRLTREGAPTEVFVVMNPADTVEEFLPFAAGRESRTVSVEGRKGVFGAGGRSQVLALFADAAAPDLTATPSPIPTPSTRVEARAAFVVGADGWNEAIEAAGAYPLPDSADEASSCDWLDRVEAWLIGE